ncbi:MAG: MFS transporter [Thermoleophilaceae bacterium]|nr:MFS transporter [Thermoleophilaceae bacterium]
MTPRPEGRSRAQWGALIAASLGTAMLLLDVTIVYVALPAIAADLNASFVSVQWVIDAYTVVMAATLLAAGVIADRFGRRRVFASGVILFSGASALCGVASSGIFLDVARGIQGIGAAAIFAASLALLANAFRGADRGFALGIWGAITGVALAIGPLIGGLVVEGLDWRWIFLVNVPVGALLLGITYWSVAESRAENPDRVDVPGALLFGTACLLAAIGLTRGNDAGWGDPWILAALIGALLALAGFIAVERASDAPMLPLELFRIPAFTGTAVVAFAQSVAIYPLLFFLAIYLQDGLGYSPIGAGLRLLPLTLLILLVAPFAGRLTGRYPLRIPLTIGLVLLGAALLAMRGLSASDEWTALLPGMILGGLGIGAISPSLAAAMVAVLPVERSGLSSGINNTFRQLGIAMGVAGLGALFDSRVEARAGALVGIVNGVNAVALAAAVVALLSAAIAWPLLRGQRSG